MASLPGKDPGVRRRHPRTNDASPKRIRREVPRLAFNQQDAAEALGISVDHFERHVKPNLSVVYSGSLRLYPRSALEQWLSQEAIRGGRGRRVA
jgi:hypothetical protein